MEPLGHPTASKIGPIDLLESFDVDIRKPDRRDLRFINDIIAAAVGSWNLSARLKRISLPLYRYRENDLEYMQFHIAETANCEILGFAAVEQGHATEFAGVHDGWLLHGLFVSPHRHCRGIGTRLLESVERVAIEKGVYNLLVKAQVDAGNFFDGAGFAKLPIEDSARDYPHRYWKRLI